MQVILQEKIKNLGSIGEIVDVKPGYARNYLFRSGKALPATKEHVALVMERKSELEKIELQKLTEAKKRVSILEKLESLDLSVPTNEEGKLFGSVGSSEVVDLLLSNGHEVSKQEVSILEMPIREVGDYTVVVQAHPDVAAHIVLKLTSSTVTQIVTKASDDKDSASESKEESETESSNDNEVDTDVSS
ncbi:MAG: 50S ribosomal protein L9 [Legionellales bacterium]|jgi:large subunit ribosomal protein L9|nr:50S ribosomal protein L9 [Legionellales bacterium]